MIRSLAAVLLFILLSKGTGSCTTPQTSNDENWKVASPASYKNLQIFLISAEPEQKGHEYVTLDQALKKAYVEIHETGRVDELSISNHSDEYVYINSGDIIKGGKQDRTLKYDMIIAPNTKKSALPSFCVEAGRWDRRGHEEVEKFSVNNKMLSSRALKLAVKLKQQQSEVWSNVSAQQVEINKNLTASKGRPVNVTSNKSSSSLQLTLENDELQEMIKEYKQNITKQLNSFEKATGFAYAINGEIYGIDIYKNPTLFQDLWQKHLEAISAEAISKLNEYKPGQEELAEVEDVEKLLRYKKTKSISSEKVNSQTEFNIYKSGHCVVFETILKDTQEKVHINYVTQTE